jgi:hypothetical protein
MAEAISGHRAANERLQTRVTSGLRHQNRLTVFLRVSCNSSRLPRPRQLKPASSHLQ